MKTWVLVVVVVIWLALGLVATGVSGLTEGSSHGTEKEVSASLLTNHAG